ncbi:MAG TPA: hypothetical protein VI455_20295 [Terriglobia bacterium]
MDPNVVSPWGADWVWSLPLIVVTVVIHSLGLGLIDQRVALALDSSRKNRAPGRFSVLIMGGTALCVTILHGFEGSIWAAAYLLLGALPDPKSATLYSLNAMTAFGHVNLYLELHLATHGVA